MRAALDELPDLIGPGAAPLPLRFHAPDGAEHAGAHALLVSNNSYRLGGLGHSAWRPRLDSGSLGVLTVRVDDGPAAARLAWLELFGRGHLSPGYSRWSAPALTIDADGPMRAGLDGEPATLTPPLRFVTLPGALVVRLPLAPRRSSARRLVEESRHLVSVAIGRGPHD